MEAPDVITGVVWFVSIVGGCTVGGIIAAKMIRRAIDSWNNESK